MHELPALSGKTIKTVSTLEVVDFAAEVHITFTDGSTLILSGPHITLKYWTTAAEPPAGLAQRLA